MSKPLVIFEEGNYHFEKLFKIKSTSFIKSFR